MMKMTKFGDIVRENIRWILAFDIALKSQLPRFINSVLLSFFSLYSRTGTWHILLGKSALGFN
jgi:hypothetical protein